MGKSRSQIVPLTLADPQFVTQLVVALIHCSDFICVLDAQLLEGCLLRSNNILFFVQLKLEKPFYAGTGWERIASLIVLALTAERVAVSWAER